MKNYFIKLKNIFFFFFFFFFKIMKLITNLFIKNKFFLIIITFLLTIFSILMSKQTNKNNSSIIYKSVPYIEKKPKWKLRNSNPLPPKLSLLSTNKQLYVMIIDDEFQSKPHQCKMKNQWINEFLENPRIDGIEFYSLNSWENNECNISSITINELPQQTFNPSSFLLIKSFELFLNRSNSEWLFITGDYSYIKTNRFFDYIDKVTNGYIPSRDRFMLGCCVEQRYFFQMLTINSGILFSRKLIEEYVNSINDHLWNVSFDVGINADEILAQISDKIGINIPSKQTHEFLGRTWRDINHFDLLLSKSFSNLPKCNIPYEYLRPPPGELGLCAAQIYPLNELSVWSALSMKGKDYFLENAELMLENIPSNVSYYWDRLYPTLCIK